MGNDEPIYTRTARRDNRRDRARRSNSRAWRSQNHFLDYALVIGRQMRQPETHARSRANRSGSLYKGPRPHQAGDRQAKAFVAAVFWPTGESKLNSTRGTSLRASSMAPRTCSCAAYNDRSTNQDQRDHSQTTANNTERLKYPVGGLQPRVKRHKPG